MIFLQAKCSHKAVYTKKVSYPLQYPFIGHPALAHRFYTSSCRVWRRCVHQKDFIFDIGVTGRLTEPADVHPTHNQLSPRGVLQLILWLFICSLFSGSLFAPYYLALYLLLILWLFICSLVSGSLFAPYYLALYLLPILWLFICSLFSGSLFALIIWLFICSLFSGSLFAPYSLALYLLLILWLFICSLFSGPLFAPYSLALYLLLILWLFIYSLFEICVSSPLILLRISILTNRVK